MKKVTAWSRHKVVFYTCLLAATLLLLNACLSAAAPEPMASPLVSPLTSPLSTPNPQPALVAATAEQVAELVRGNNTFAFDLYQAVAAGDEENLIYSPYSISLAFSLAYAGARSETEQQIAETLHFLPQTDHHSAFYALNQQLTRLTTAAGSEGGDDFRLNIANALWGQQGFPIQESYLQTIAQHYGAELQEIDFAQNPEAARQAINAWVAEQTEDRIKDLVPPGMLTPLTKLVLANAIYFYGSWLYPFNQTATEDGAFTLLDGSQVTVPLMHHAFVRIPYAAGDGYQAVLLPYWGDQVDMLILLPELDRFHTMETALSADFIGGVRDRLSRHDMTLTMPRFDFETTLDLKETLSAMGMSAPFGAANFSSIGPGLFISDALHRGVITVDEEGTEAAAATALAMATSALQRAEIVIDHPFIFAIVARETGTILFLGRVMNPA